ncbi:Retrovirus-related Pol polyprotein from transposon 412-like Protein [Tribolium castaneum]|uniref:Retrovirus-related Pol polyprotein from transposon 412-like Protein n=1 Tax=Tribolium castaneum TaxID=7070 RepID=D7EKU9_TRICA|nr:Retrovirus-related Pol polyprotein from transposon 412-like Protein [Tribolium castaneum]
MSLTEFDFEVQYRPGKQHHVDAFTRLEYPQEEMSIQAIQQDFTPIIYNLEEIKKAQSEDKDIQSLLLQEGYYQSPNGLCYKERLDGERHDKLLVPKTMQRRILQLKNHPIPAAEMQTMPVPTCTFGLVSMDIVGPLNVTSSGNKYILTCMDYLTRYPECMPIKDMKAETVARAFITNVILRHGTPRILLTDCGTQFVSDLFTEVCLKLQIEKIQTSPYRPSTNGVIERMHHVLKIMLSHYVTDEESDWDEMLPYVLMAYRNRRHDATNESPFFLMFGRDMELPFYTLIKPDRVRYNLDSHYPEELMARMKKVLLQAADYSEAINFKRRDRLNRNRKLRDFQIGDRVYLYTPAVKGKKLASKFYPKWTGPFRIIAQTGAVNYKI